MSPAAAPVLPPLGLASLRDAYGRGALRPTGLIDALWDRLEAYGDPAVWIHRLSREELRAHARRVEARGPATQPLYGVPFAIKDNIDLAGAPTTAACPAFATTPAESAPAVQRLLEAGAIPLGKTNLDQFATGLVGVRSPYGTPRNPFRADLIPGGSSSGSAVAVAAGLATFSLGTDTAGSGRIPAGLNDLVGLKPTRGAISARGVVPACRSLDCVSVFALTCADAAEVLRVAEGFDPADPYSRRRAAPAPLPSGVRFGVPAELDFDGDAEAARAFADSLARIAALGGHCVTIDFAPFRAAAALLYQGPWIAERWAALRAFHRDHAEAFLPLTRAIVESGAAASAADAFDGQYRLAAIARQTEAEWAKMDVLLVPTAPRPYTLAEIAAEPLARNTRLGTYTNFVNLLDLSALAVPAGIRTDGAPWGVTFIAPAWRDYDLLELGRAWQAPAQRIRLAVVGAHLAGLPLNHQLTDRGARRVWSGTTAPAYRLYALPGTQPPKPGMIRAAQDGAAIALEVWDLPVAQFGAFVAAVPRPLAIGSVELSTGEWVKGFLCEPDALTGAEDITSFGGWRSFLAR
jgi:allophanate hydrolase